MDFLKSVIAEHEKDKNELKKKIEGQDDNTTKRKKKYIRKGEFDQILNAKLSKEQAAYLTKKKQVEEQKKKEDYQNLYTFKRRKVDNNSVSSSHSSIRKLQTTTNNEQTEEEEKESTEQMASESLLEVGEVKRRLRSLGQPITIFGESERDRSNRLQQAQHQSFNTNDTELSGAYRDSSSELIDQGEKPPTMDHDEDDDDDDEGFEKDDKGEKEEKNAKYVYKFFRRMLKLWERDLSDRPEEIKRSAKGRSATKTMKQCKDYIRPLFKLCKYDVVPDDILPNLICIVTSCEEHDYVKANDAYIRLAIGNAAWPIGVTMVGIHERTGREKINSNKQAHVMNNEAQRKYLTSVKRLISYSQSASNAAPSKRVL